MGARKQKPVKVYEKDLRPACAWHDVSRLLACPYKAADGSAYCRHHAEAKAA